jgi:hypothetical protein
VEEDETGAIYNQDFKKFVALMVSVDKALAYFARHPEKVFGLFGRYCEESGVALGQAL